MFKKQKSDEKIRAELRNGPLEGQHYDVPKDTETLLLAISPANLDAGCYVYTKGLATVRGEIYGFAYRGKKLGYAMQSLMEVSSKIA